MSRDIEVEDCRFYDGESPLKESTNITVNHCTFEYKYPLWYCESVEVKDTTFEPISRSGIWYTNNITLTDCLINAPKEFRRSSNITLERVTFTDGQETLWNCKEINIKDCKVKGDYLLMNSEDIIVENLELNGNYFCDSAKNVTCKNCVLYSKDSFWNCENVTLINCKIIGEYFGWNSKNIYMENCEVESLQGFCYIDNLEMKNCILNNTTLSFEYTTVDAIINSVIDSVKNPMGGKIVCKGIKELIIDENCKNPGQTEIIEEKDV